MAQPNFLPRGRRLLRRAPGLLLCLLAGPLAHAASVTVEVRGVVDGERDNVLAFLSFERFRRGGMDLNADTVERLHNRVEREVAAALRPFGYYEPKVESTVTEQGRGDWRVVVDINPGPPVLLDHVDVRVEGPGASDPLFQRILNNLPMRSGDRLKHAAYDAVRADLQRTAATFGYVDAKLIRNELLVDPPNHTANLEVLPGDPDHQALTVPVRIRADPGRRHRYSIGGGWATDTGIRGTFAYEDRRINSLGHSLSVSVQASQVQKYYVLSRYRIPVGDPAVENVSLNALVQQQTLADVTAITQSAGASWTDVTAGWQHVWQLNGVHTVSDNSAPTVVNVNQSRSDELIVPELTLARVPTGFLGEPR